MKNIILIILFNVISFNGLAGGTTQLPVTAIIPAYNTSISTNSMIYGTEVLIGYDRFRFPCLEALVNFEGDTEYIEIDANNNMEITISAEGRSPCLNLSTSYEQFQKYSLGVLPVGQYTIQMYWTGPSTPLPVPPNLNRILHGLLIEFEVVAPVVVPFLNGYMVVALVLMIVFLAWIYFRKSSKLIVLSMLTSLLLTTSLSAKTYLIQLSSDVSAPTPDEVMGQTNISPAPPVWLLNAFNILAPDAVEYLLLPRPTETGNLQTLLNNHPNWSLARLYQTLIVRYPDNIDENVVLANFANDIHIVNAEVVSNDELVISAGLVNNSPKQATLFSINNSNKRGAGSSYLADLNINAAWELSEGMGYISTMDLGLQLNHPDLETFDSAGNYLGGNVLGEFYQIDYGLIGYDRVDLNVDEAEATDTCWQSGTLPGGTPICDNPFHNGLESCDLADGIDDDLASIAFLGHGTHISGIISNKNSSIGGICKNCGLSMMKISFFSGCFLYDDIYHLAPEVSYHAVVNSLRLSAQQGVGTVNWSGGRSVPDDNYCDINRPICIAKDFVLEQNVMLVSSAGNGREHIQFPANEVGTLAVGGLMPWDNGGFTELAYWNESPLGGVNGNVFEISETTNCPPVPVPETECGANFLTGDSAGNNTVPNRRLDVSTQAQTVYSTFYQGQEWNDLIDCSDDAGDSGTPNDGYANCSGTSMSSPQAASIIQLMRSAHPLLPNGTYDPSQNDGLINVINATASHADLTVNLNYDPQDYYGYGLPNARVALEKILGQSNGVQMKTRLTPMFVDVSTGMHNNHIYTPFPQLAMAFLILDELYLPDTSVPVVNEFTDFWYDHVSQPPLSFPAPRAEFYVFTTNNNPFDGTKNMVPLRRMYKSVADNRNDTYAISPADIQNFHDDDYEYAGIEGYILPFDYCIISGCPGATRLYRDETDNLNHKLVASNTAPPNSVVLGFVYLNQDSDGDGLIDGQEIILGTNILVADSDGDNLSDGQEYPPAGVPLSDPLISDNTDVIFVNGFE